MPRARLTLDDCKHLGFEDLNVRAYALLQPYETPAAETEAMRDARISKTLDELPDIYAWLLQAHAYFDYWTDRQGELYGLKSNEYREMRERRDMMENAARAAKQRYDGTSRRITDLQRHEEEATLPRTRRA